MTDVRNIPLMIHFKFVDTVYKRHLNITMWHTVMNTWYIKQSLDSLQGHHNNSAFLWHIKYKPV